MTGCVFNIQRYSVHDGPGIRTTVFLKGCPLRCKWCHNPESQGMGPELGVTASRCIRCGACAAACPREAVWIGPDGLEGDRRRCISCGICARVCPPVGRELVGRDMDVDAVVAAVERDRAFYEESGGGVTFSGGEPMQQSDFVTACMEACRERGWHVALDTCGFASQGTLLRMAERADLVLYDVKLVDDEKHREWTGASCAGILRNLATLLEAGKSVWVRVPIVPGANDDDESVEALGDYLCGLPAPAPVHLLPYHDIGRDKYERFGKTYYMAGTPEPSPDQIHGIRDRLAARGLEVAIGG